MWNSYAYGRNNPYKMVDPDGRAFFDVINTLISSASGIVDRSFNAITLGSGDVARDMAHNGVTASGVARVTGGVITGSVGTGIVAAGTGYISGITAVQTGVVTVAPRAATMATGLEAIKGATGGGMTVYQSIKDGVLEYVGITNNFVRRAAEHQRPSGREIQAMPGATNLSVDAARGVEQILIEQYGLAKNGGTLSNLINSISLRNPEYNRLVELGRSVLDAIE